MTSDFDIFVGEDKVRVRFVSAAKLGGFPSGHRRYGVHQDGTIELPRYEMRGANATTLLHELGHYLVRRTEMGPELRRERTSEETICDLLAWLPAILRDRRNVGLRAMLRLERLKDDDE